MILSTERRSLPGRCDITKPHRTSFSTRISNPSNLKIRQAMASALPSVCAALDQVQMVVALMLLKQNQRSVGQALPLDAFPPGR
jgi:hypothetical protein